MAEQFKDLFSKQSAVYKKHRPDHPMELIAYLASLCPEHELAWDCGTGNGQAAVKLADHFKHVFSTDASENQIRNAVQHPKIAYAVQHAEKIDLPTASVDLISIAVALHWFAFDAFYTQAKRVLKPDGIIAAWTYVLPVIDPQTDAIIADLHDNTLGRFWFPENKLGLEEYAAIPFPFTLIATPEFYYTKKMSLEDFLGLLYSWSAVQRYIDEVGDDPIPETAAALQTYWKADEEKEVVWKVILKVGRQTINGAEDL